MMTEQRRYDVALPQPASVEEVGENIMKLTMFVTPAQWAALSTFDIQLCQTNLKTRLLNH